PIHPARLRIVEFLRERTNCGTHKSKEICRRKKTFAQTALCIFPNVESETGAWESQGIGFVGRFDPIVWIGQHLSGPAQPQHARDPFGNRTGKPGAVLAFLEQTVDDARRRPGTAPAVVADCHAECASCTAKLAVTKVLKARYALRPAEGIEWFWKNGDR